MTEYEIRQPADNRPWVMSGLAGSQVESYINNCTPDEHLRHSLSQMFHYAYGNMECRLNPQSFRNSMAAYVEGGARIALQNMVECIDPEKYNNYELSQLGNNTDQVNSATFSPMTLTIELLREQIDNSKEVDIAQPFVQLTREGMSGLFRQYRSMYYVSNLVKSHIPDIVAKCFPINQPRQSS